MRKLLNLIDNYIKDMFIVFIYLNSVYSFIIATFYALNNNVYERILIYTLRELELLNFYRNLLELLK